MSTTTTAPEPRSFAAGELITAQPTALDAVRRELRRSDAAEPWHGSRLRAQLPRVALDEALAILLAWRGQSRFGAGAVAWHARLAGCVPALTLDDAERALRLVAELGRPCPEPAASALRRLCAAYGLGDVATVLDDWLAKRHRAR